MALSIKDPQADSLARELAKITGEKITAAVVNSLRERLDRLKKRRKPKKSRYEEIMKIVEEIRALPVYDTRTPDEIMGFNEQGHFD